MKKGILISNVPLMSVSSSSRLTWKIGEAFFVMRPYGVLYAGRSVVYFEQVEHAKSEAFPVFKDKVHDALVSGAQKFNRKQSKGGFISISMKVHGGPQRTYAIPAPAAESMQLEIQCEECNSRFAVIGSAFFCPACGHNSVRYTFSDSLRKIRAKKEGLDIVRQALAEAGRKDDAELTCRLLIESRIQDGVVAFRNIVMNFINLSQPRRNKHSTSSNGYNKPVNCGRAQ